ncbi:hypothetical protein GQX73_g537 [Xylaria multiplex]|uniref:Uncharacterized protein n=1 Tax=Xylaria multiplex TaxID=323545 RepID=A0A7C8IUW7_9PEZI|nr:hypothetical protein GQX73_g537 [Xylaria multiplex]
MSNPTSQQIKSITPPSIEEREVQTLEAIADSQYLTEGWPMLGTPHDARSIIQLLMRHSLAIRDPESPRVKQFVNRYYEVSTWNIQTVNFIRLHYELQQFFGRLDELFFFGLLTRSVARPSSGRKNLLELGIFDTVSAEGCYGLCSNQRSTSASAKPTTGSGSTTASSPKLESKEPPKSEAERQIGTLEAVADGLFGPSRHRGRYDTPYDGRTMALLSINHCLAVQDPSSSRVTRFAEQYAEVKTWYLETIDFEVLKDELWQLFARLDELFFFGLLSRKVDSPMGRRPVLIVEIIDDYDKKCHYAGRYLPKEGKIRLWLRDYRHPENRRSFRVILGTLLHELTHAYLGLADKKHENHGKWVADCKSHGEYFWALLQYLAETIMKFTDSPSWREEMDVIDAERSIRCLLVRIQPASALASFQDIAVGASGTDLEF